jgi:hypothetical protein
VIGNFHRSRLNKGVVFVFVEAGMLAFPRAGEEASSGLLPEQGAYLSYSFIFNAVVSVFQEIMHWGMSNSPSH